MKRQQFLFVHRNAPAQFTHLLGWLLDQGHDVRFASQTVSAVLPDGVARLELPEPASKSKADLKQFEQQLFDKLERQKRKGLDPDWILLHTGWGLGLSLRALFPRARLLAYAEWWFNFDSDDVLFDPDNHDVAFPTARRLAMLARDRAFAFELATADVIVAPTAWQRQQLPPLLRQHCEVIHDGCDVAYFAPGAARREDPPLHLTPALAALPPPDTTLITYATRGMDPYRGFPEWGRAITRLLQARPDVHVAIAGRDRTVYAPGQRDRRYGQEALELMAAAGVAARVHFLDYLPFAAYRWLLLRSDLHTYFTRPYVLSWSLLQAMACGCAIVASDVAPVREVIGHGRHGWLVDHRAPDLHDQLLAALEAPGWPERRAAARRRAERHYGLDQAFSAYDQLLFAAGDPGAR